MLRHIALLGLLFPVALACSGSSDAVDVGVAADTGSTADLGTPADASTGPDAGTEDSSVAMDASAPDVDVADTSAPDIDPPDMAVMDTGTPAPFELNTTAFMQDAMIPLRYECGGRVIMGPGENIAPDLSWTAGPAGTQSYAIVMDDVDTGVVHWVIYDIPQTTADIAEDLPAGYSPAFPAGAHQAEIQGSGYYGYFGPCSPNSINTYRWTIYAIPTATLQEATQQTTEYQMVTLIQDQQIASAFLAVNPSRA